MTDPASDKGVAGKVPVSRKRELCFIGAVALLPVFVFLPHLFSPINVGDNIVEFMPHYRYIFTMIRSLKDPLWNPYLFSGFPMASYPSATPYEPLGWVHLFLPAAVAGNLHVVLIYSVASVGYYLFARAMGLGLYGSFLVGMMCGTAGYTLSAFASILAYTGAPWPGYAFAALEMLRKSRGVRRRVKWTLLMALVCGVEYLGGHPYVFMHTCLFMGMYTLLVGFGLEKGRARWAWFGCSFAAVALAVMIGMAVTLPGVEFQEQSWRADLSYPMFLGVYFELSELLSGAVFPLVHFMDIRIPYIGVVPLLLAFYGLRGKYGDERYKALIFIALVSAALTLGDNTILPGLIYEIPGLNRLGSFRRFRLLLVPAVAIMSGAGLDFLLESGKWNARKWLAGLGAVYAVALVAMVIAGDINYLGLSAGVVAPLFVFLGLHLCMTSRRKRWLILGAAVFLMQSALFIDSYFTDDKDRVDTETPSPVLQYVQNEKDDTEPPPRYFPVFDLGKHSMRELHAAGVQNFSENQRLHNAAGYNPLLMGHYSQLMRMSFLGFPGEFRKLIAPPAIIPDILNISYYSIPKKYLENYLDRLWTFPDMIYHRGVPFLEEVYLDIPAGGHVEFNTRAHVSHGIATVSAFNGSPETPQGGEVARLTLKDGKGGTRQAVLKAGEDTAAIGHVLITSQPDVLFERGGIPFFEALDIFLSKDLRQVSLYGRGFNAKGVAFVSWMVDSLNEPQGKDVATLKIHGKDGSVLEVPVRAGIETADWSVDIYSGMAKHGSISEANSLQSPDGLKGKAYCAVINFDEPIEVGKIDLVLTGDDPVNLYVTSMTLIGPDGSFGAARMMPMPAHKMPRDIFYGMGKNKSHTRELYNLYYAFKDFDTPIDTRGVRIENLLTSGQLIIRAITLIGANDKSNMPLTYFDHILGDPENYEKTEMEGVFIWRKKKQTPRAWLAANVIWQDDEAILDILRNGMVASGIPFDPWNMALVGPDVPKGMVAGGKTRGGVRFDHYSPNECRLKAACDRRSMLVLSEGYYPGWKAYVDGAETPVYRVDYAIRGVFIDPGLHDVVFLYKPWRVGIGRLISAATLGLMLVVWMVVVWRYPRSGRYET